MSRILIVEDDEDIGAVLQRELVKEGFEVLRAVTGTEGRMMLGQSPDLILMDLMLPGLTGEELLTHIPKEIPVIAVSARSSVDDKVALLSEGCVDYITKPFDIKELKARVNVALRTAEGKKCGGRIACGDMLTHNASEFVNVTTAQTIGGVKSFKDTIIRNVGNFTAGEAPTAQTTCTVLKHTNNDSTHSANSILSYMFTSGNQCVN